MNQSEIDRIRENAHIDGEWVRLDEWFMETDRNKVVALAGVLIRSDPQEVRALDDSCLDIINFLAITMIRELAKRCDEKASQTPEER